MRWRLTRHASYALQEAKIVVQRWPDNLDVLVGSKQGWQNHIEFALIDRDPWVLGKISWKDFFFPPFPVGAGMAQAKHMPSKGQWCLPLRLPTRSHYTSLWLWLPLLAWLRYPTGPIRALGLCIPDSIKEWILSGAPRIYDREDLELPGNRQIALPSILTRYFSSELTIHQFEALLIAKACRRWQGTGCRCHWVP